VLGEGAALADHETERAGLSRQRRQIDTAAAPIRHVAELIAAPANTCLATRPATATNCAMRWSSAEAPNLHPTSCGECRVIGALRALAIEDKRSCGR
jgi:hypothetical protein